MSSASKGRRLGGTRTYVPRDRSSSGPPTRSSETRRDSPRKKDPPSPNGPRRKRAEDGGGIRETSPLHRRRRTSISNLSQGGKPGGTPRISVMTPPSRRNPLPSSLGGEGEEFVFWKPEEILRNRPHNRNSPSKIPIPDKSSSRINRPAKPKMGVPVMTSTPRIFGSPITYPKEEPPPINSPEKKKEEEPIYCEIGETSQDSLSREETKNNNRQSLSDFPSKINRRVPYSSLLSDKQQIGLLGRRAATQFDFIGSREPPSATTVLSEFRSDLPPRTMYNHMAGIPYSQPPQRKFIPGLSGINGYCSDNDFSSLANESIASTSVPGHGPGEVSEINVNPGSTLKKGLMWQQRDKLFSRWKERFFILTKDYLQCFRRGSSRISEMGAFIFRIKLVEVDEVELIDKRGYLTISLSLGKDGKVLLRKPDGIRDWFTILKECVAASRERKGMMKSTKEFWSKKQFTDSSSMEQYILARQRIGRQYAYSTENGGCSESFSFDSSALPTHLKIKLKQCGTPPPTSSGAPSATTTTNNNLKHYGYIDVPRGGLAEEKTQIQSLCAEMYLKGNVRDFPSEYSHDSGVDSMNTNSSGSVMSGSITSPLMNRPSKFIFKSPEEDALSVMQSKHLKRGERDRKISLV